MDSPCRLIFSIQPSFGAVCCPAQCKQDEELINPATVHDMELRMKGGDHGINLNIQVQINEGLLGSKNFGVRNNCPSSEANSEYLLQYYTLRHSS
jgi:hypothetical protein